MTKTLNREGYRSDKFDTFMNSVREQRRTLITAILINATLFKDNAYFEEKEWRIVILSFDYGIPESNEPNESGILVKYRSGVIGITPYIEFPLGLRTAESPLRKIVVGPTPYMDQAVKGVEMLLEYKGIRLKSKDYPDGVEVVPSKIPYRNW